MSLSHSHKGKYTSTHTDVGHVHAQTLEHTQTNIRICTHTHTRHTYTHEYVNMHKAQSVTPQPLNIDIGQSHFLAMDPLKAQTKIMPRSVQCVAGYYHIKYGHLLGNNY